MPIGIFTDVTATLCGALQGCVLSARLGDSWKKLLHNLLGIAAIVMGIVLIIRAKNLSAVILALLLGAGWFSFPALLCQGTDCQGYRLMNHLLLQLAELKYT